MTLTKDFTVAAEDIRHLEPEPAHCSRSSEKLRWRRLRLGGNWTREQVQRTGGGTNLIGCDPKISGCGAEVAMTEQQLNGPNIGAGFEQMDGKGVSKQMRGNRLGKAGDAMGFLTGGLNGEPSNRSIRQSAREQPLLRACGLPVAAENIQQLG